MRALFLGPGTNAAIPREWVRPGPPCTAMKTWKSHVPCYSCFPKKSLTPTVAKEFQIGLYDPVELDLKLFFQTIAVRDF